MGAVQRLIARSHGRHGLRELRAQITNYLAARSLLDRV